MSRAHWGKPGLFEANDTTGLVHSDKNHTTEHLSTVFYFTITPVTTPKPQLKLMHAKY